MRKLLIFLVLLGFGIKYGSDYVFSPEFEAQADKSKEPLTCRFENFMGQFNIVMSHYDTAIMYFTRTTKRCPDTDLAEDADFGIAQSLEKLGRFSQASHAYADFAEKYKNSDKQATAIKASQILASQ